MSLSSFLLLPTGRMSFEYIYISYKLMAHDGQLGALSNYHVLERSQQKHDSPKQLTDSFTAKPPNSIVSIFALAILPENIGQKYQEGASGTYLNPPVSVYRYHESST
jgi:hypothetical protein